jgi:Putative prokaryotic signal transducing protein
MADDDLKIVATVNSEPEAEMVRIRLLEAGIQAVSQRTIGGPEWGLSGARYVYVREQDLVRARELIESDEGISEQELSRQSDEAGKEPRNGPAHT